jgi:hypothetical protein
MGYSRVMGYPSQELAKKNRWEKDGLWTNMSYLWIKTVLIDDSDILDIYSIRSFLMKVRRLDQRRTAITSIRVARVADQSFS